MKRIATDYPGVFYREGQRIGGSGVERIYYVLFKKDGKLFEEKVGRQFADAMTPAKAARIRAARIEGKAKSRKEIREEKKTEASQWTIGRLWEEYQEHLTGKTKRVDDNRYQNWLKKDFEHKEPKDILYLDVERLKRSMLKERAPQTVRHVLQLLNRVINYGVKRGLCSPAPFKIQMPEVNNLKTEDLTDEQLIKLLEAIDADEDQAVADIMRMALYTGMRRGELFKLQWRDVDFQKGFIHIRAPKGGKDQVIPMNEAARAVLARQERAESDYLFPNRQGGQRVDVHKVTNRIKKAAGLPADFRAMHGLRHVFASMLASSGKVDLYTLQRLLTHKSPVMTQRYAHLRDEALKKAADVAAEIYRGHKKGAV